MDVFEFAIKVNDLASNKLTALAVNADSVFGRVGRAQDRWHKKVNKSGGLINGLDQKLKVLHQNKRSATTVNQIKRLNAEITKAERSLNKLKNLPPKSMGERFRQIGGSMKGMMLGAVGTIGVLGAFSAIKGISKLGMDLEMTRIKFDTMLGSREKANNMIAQINTFANKTPYENDALQNSAIKLLNFGIAGNKILPTMKMLGDIAGGEREKMDRLALAFGQINAKGKLMGGELLQLTEAGFNPLQIISKKTGESMASLYKRMSKGKISVSEVEGALQTATSSGGRFHNMMSKLSQTGSGKLSTLVGTWKNKLAEFSEQYLIPSVNKILTFGIQIVNQLSKLKAPILSIWDSVGSLLMKIGLLVGVFFGVTQGGDAVSGTMDTLATIFNWLAVGIEIVSTGLGVLIDGLSWMMPVLKPLLIGLGVFKILLIAVNFLMYANPIGLIVGGLALLIGSLVVAYRRFDTFRGILHGSWEAIKQIGTTIKDYLIDRVVGLIKGLGSLGKALSHLFKGEFSEAFEAGKNGLDGIFGVSASMKAFNNAKKVGESFKKGFKDGSEKTFEESSLTKLGKGLKVGSTPVVTSKSPLQGSITGGGSSNTDLAKGIENTISGGSKQNSIMINFEKFQDEFIIQVQNMEEGFDQAEDRLKEMLLRMINSGNSVQTN